MLKVFIINPVAGNGKALKCLEYIKEAHEDAIIEITKDTFSATDIAQKYSNSNALIYSVGGDGTLNEVVNGIVDGNSILRIIPAGSGNDFAKTIYTDFNLSNLISNEDGIIKDVDIGIINERYFINAVAIGGIDALVGKNTNESKGKNYNKNVLKSLLQFKSPSLCYKIKGDTVKEHILLFAVCNGKYYGNGYNIAPKAEIDDGLFDVYIAHDVSKMRGILSLPSLKKGNHGDLKFIKYIKSDTIDVVSDEDLICNIDGEIDIDKEFHIKTKSKKIKLLI